ncbi:MAG: GGDEF domain-containing protein [Herbaspirillum sp.]
MLSTILQLEFKNAETNRRAERVQAEAMLDTMTTAYNRRGWDWLMTLEEERCRLYGHPAAVLVLDLDNLKQINDTSGHMAGDDVIVRTTQALRQAVRSHDIVARLGGDEFGILAVECPLEAATALHQRIEAALAAVHIVASIGLSMRDPATGLKAAWENADQLMYQEKRTR